AERSIPRPRDPERNNSRPLMQQSGPTPGMDRPRNNDISPQQSRTGIAGDPGKIGNGENQRHRPAEDRPASRPSYGDRSAAAAPVQQAAHSPPTPPIPQPSDSRHPTHKSHPPNPPRASEPQRSSAPQPHPSGSGNSGGSRGSESHGKSQSSGQDHGNSH